MDLVYFFQIITFFLISVNYSFKDNIFFWDFHYHCHERDNGGVAVSIKLR